MRIYLHTNNPYIHPDVQEFLNIKSLNIDKDNNLVSIRIIMKNRKQYNVAIPDKDLYSVTLYGGKMEELNK